MELIKKPNNKWRICVDFIDHNKACPKDHYPLLSIDNLVNTITDHEVCSLLDVIVGSHQILKEESNTEKTAFISNERVLCYKEMPFGLKNTRATYKRI